MRKVALPCLAMRPRSSDDGGRGDVKSGGLWRMEAVKPVKAEEGSMFLQPMLNPLVRKAIGSIGLPGLYVACFLEY